MVIALMDGDYSPPLPVHSAYAARCRLERIAQAMTSPGFELDTHEAAGVLSAFDAAREAGVGFDPFTLALVNVLRRQLNGSDDVDPLEDDDPAGSDDDRLDADDPHEDGSDEELCGPINNGGWSLKSGILDTVPSITHRPTPPRRKRFTIAFRELDHREPAAARIGEAVSHG